MEEVDNEEMTMQIRSRILDEAGTIMDEIVEKYFIRKMELEGMPKLWQDSDDNEENEDGNEVMVFQIENGRRHTISHQLLNWLRGKPRISIPR